MDPITPNPDPGVGGGAPPPVPAWHEGIITKDAAGAESLADPASWLNKAPAPLQKFITDNMTAARARTDGMVKIPGADAKPEDWEPIYKALGRPDNPDGYGLKALEKMPDGVSWDDNFAKEFQGVAHKLGLTPAQVRALSEFQVGVVGRQVEAARAASAQAIVAEKAELDKLGGELPKIAEAAQAAGARYGIPKEAFDPTHGEFWGVPALLAFGKLAQELAAMKQEDTSHRGSGNQILSGRAYATAASTDPNHPDYAKFQAGDPEVVARVKAGYASAA
jgi:hypothetical protein